MSKNLPTRSVTEIMKSGAKTDEEKTLLERYKTTKESERDDEDSGRPEFQRISSFAGDKQAKLILPNDEMVSDIDIVILSHKYQKHFYKPDDNGGGKSDEDSVLFCQSFGGRTGTPTQEGRQECGYLEGSPIVNCHSCPANVFGSRGKGKLCGDSFKLIVWSEKFDTPLSFKVPPTSWTIFNSYQNRIKNSDDMMCGIFTSIIPIYNKSGQMEWSTFKFDRGERIEDAKLLSDLMTWNLKLEQEYQNVKLATEVGGIEPSDDPVRPSYVEPQGDRPVPETTGPIDPEPPAYGNDDDLPF